MVNVITQETFNEAVQENMTLFDLDVEEGIKETVSQFKSQGVDLTNIVKESWCVLGLEDPLASACGRLAPESATLSQDLATVTSMCKRDMSFRLSAAKAGAYDRLVTVLSGREDDGLLCACLDALCALMEGYPDLLESRGTDVLMNLLDREKNEEVRCRALEWARVCCMLHEVNRQFLFDHGVSDKLLILLDGASDRSTGGICKLVSALVLDDDVRQAVSGSHPRACSLATSLLPRLVIYLSPRDALHDSPRDLFPVLTAVASLLVRDTLCRLFVDQGGLTALLPLLNVSTPVTILSRGFDVLSCLSGHDTIRDSIIDAGLAPLISFALSKSSESVYLCRSVLSLIARLSLRSPRNAECLYSAGIGEPLVHALRTFGSDQKVQNLGLLAVRNMASRSDLLRSELVSLEIDKPIRELPQQFPDLADNVKATLVALDLDVQLTERWTGTHGDKLKSNSCS